MREHKLTLAFECVGTITHRVTSVLMRLNQMLFDIMKCVINYSFLPFSVSLVRMHLLEQIPDFGREISGLKLAHLQHFHAQKRKTNAFSTSSKKVVYLPMGDVHHVIPDLSFIFGVRPREVWCNRKC